MSAIVRTGSGALKRLADVRGEGKVVCRSNRGTAKGKAMEQARMLYRHVCPQCRRDFEAIGKAVYCSNACRQKAKRERAASGGTHD